MSGTLWDPFENGLPRWEPSKTGSHIPPKTEMWESVLGKYRTKMTPTFRANRRENDSHIFDIISENVGVILPKCGTANISEISTYGSRYQQIWDHRSSRNGGVVLFLANVENRGDIWTCGDAF